MLHLVTLSLKKNIVKNFSLSLSLLPCYMDLLLPCYSVSFVLYTHYGPSLTILHWLFYILTMLHGFHLALLPEISYILLLHGISCYHVTWDILLPCYMGYLLPCYMGFLVTMLHGISCYHVTWDILLPCYMGYLLPCYMGFLVTMLHGISCYHVTWDILLPCYMGDILLPCYMGYLVTMLHEITYTHHVTRYPSVLLGVAGQFHHVYGTPGLACVSACLPWGHPAQPWGTLGVRLRYHPL